MDDRAGRGSAHAPSCPDTHLVDTHVTVESTRGCCMPLHGHPDQRARVWGGNGGGGPNDKSRENVGGAYLDATLLEEIAQLGHGGGALTRLDLVVCDTSAQGHSPSEQQEEGSTEARRHVTRARGELR
eukprot:2440244-Prymnesium_polylepis.2